MLGHSLMLEEKKPRQRRKKRTECCQQKALDHENPESANLEGHLVTESDIADVELVQVDSQMGTKTPSHDGNSLVCKAKVHLIHWQRTCKENNGNHKSTMIIRNVIKKDKRYHMQHPKRRVVHFGELAGFSTTPCRPIHPSFRRVPAMMMICSQETVLVAVETIRRCWTPKSSLDEYSQRPSYKPCQ